MRYLLNKPLSDVPSSNYDVVIVGAGLTGLYTALQTDSKLSVALVAKGALMQCNSSLAQGGIASAVMPDDSAETHLKDTMKASAGSADEKAVKLLAERGPAEIHKLVEMGVSFDTDDQGNWHATKEGAHRKKRVLHIGGDATGFMMMKTLVSKVLARKNITLFENHFLTDILTDEKEHVAGVIVFRNGFRMLRSSVVVIATGGVGGIYNYTTNHKLITGDGIAAAARAGARLQDMHYVQFHPTAFYVPDRKGPLFLISEAVRGEGAVLRNPEGDEFMSARHKLKDLAPRDIVSREIFNQMKKYQTSHVFLDITHKTPCFLEKRFPTIFRHLRSHGIKMEQHLIPVVPAQHYIMGGIKTNLQGETSVDGLFAGGEAACTGVHGANRLASNSLLECLVFASAMAESINNRSKYEMQTTLLATLKKQHLTVNIREAQDSLREIMHQWGGIVRNPVGLVYAVNTLNSLLDQLNASSLSSPDEFELANMTLVAREILLAALAQRESSGAHFLQDEIEQDMLSGLKNR